MMASTSHFPPYMMENSAKASAHTPGPWFQDGEFVFTQDRLRIADTTPHCDQEKELNWDEQCANACLIAAAPELLEHLEHIVEMAHSVSANWENGALDVAVRNLDRIATAAEVAIAKANGKA
ncbi:MAG: hypothetical protein L0Z62_46915 [Gemmataceae bacterium]|nr:hypothetical protein [Gemmataceae bacterium]